MLHKHCIFIPFDGFENLKFFSQFCEKIKPDPILIINSFNLNVMPCQYESYKLRLEYSNSRTTQVSPGL